MTMREALAWGDHIRKETPIGQRTNSSAKGAFQIVNTTQRAAMSALGISMDKPYNEVNQRRLAAWIYKEQGLGAWEGFKLHPDQRTRAEAAAQQSQKVDYETPPPTKPTTEEGKPASATLDNPTSDKGNVAGIYTGEKYPKWMGDKTKREISGVNSDLAQELLETARRTGTTFSITQGMRTQEQANRNASVGSGVKDSQHLYGSGSDTVVTGMDGHRLEGKELKDWADTFEGISKAHGGRSRWLGNSGGRWSKDTVHFDQGIGFGQTHARTPYGDLKVTPDDVKEGQLDALKSKTNPF